MNVLSLFDGISAGQFVLTKLNIDYKNYYSSEIDSNSIFITQKNFPNTIQLGDINDWQKWDIDFQSIDLILSGFPCQSFSITRHGKGFDDHRGNLFLIFNDILNYVKSENKDVKFFAENVHMKKEYSDFISQTLGVDFIEVNSADFSPQIRKRYYWTNIPFLENININELVLNDILQDEGDFYWHNEKFDFYGEDNQICGKLELNGHDLIKRVNSRWYKCRTLTGISGGNQHVKVYIDGKIRKLTVIEYERLMGFPDDYSEGISKTNRYKVLGNSWQVNTVKHLLSGICPY